MRIAFVHSFYSSSQPSGENRVVEDQVALLREAGHEVRLIGRYTDVEEKSRGYKVRTAARVATGRGWNPLRELREFAPDVVHVVNLFPNISRSWISDWPGPVVVTAHNYRAACANGLLYRDGHICTECVTQGTKRALAHRCYRGSVTATLPLAVSRRDEQVSVLGRADAVITTSEASDRVLSSAVRVPLNTAVIPNFGEGDPLPPRPADERSGWIALGRFSDEKGILELVEAWPDDRPLTVVGDGEQAAQIRQEAAGRPITVSTSVPRDEMRQLLPGFTGLVFPSRWYEVAPQVVVEAMRVGLPVLAFADNAVASIVESSGAGAIYRDAETLVRGIVSVESACDEMSLLAHAFYAANWRPQAWLDSMTAVYEQVMGRRRG